MTRSTDAPAMPPGGQRYGAWFDAVAAARACAFFARHLRHTEGEWAGRPFHLLPWQAERIIRPVFGWKRADGSRLVRVVYVEVPRKNGKTELLAGVSHLALLGDGEMGGQGYFGAVDKDQAKIAFVKASTMAQTSPSLAAELEVLKTSVYCPQLMAVLKPLSRAPATKHGFSPSFFGADELHEWPDGELYDVVHKGTGARRQPLEVLITTAGLKNRGFGWEMHEYARQVSEGVIEDPTFLPVIYAADDEDDWLDERVWAKANPSLGHILKIDYLRAEAAKARRSPRLENDFRRFHLNQWTEQATRWLPLHDWDACAGPVAWPRLEEALAGRTCWAGLDLGVSRDLTALSLAFPPEADEAPWFFIWRFWLPEHDLAARCARDHVPYDQWAREGAIKLTHGNVTDYRAVEHEFEALAKVFDIREIAMDPYNATQVAVELQDRGAPLVYFRQGFLSMNPPSQDFERLVLSHALVHGGHPVARWMARNVAVATDAAGSIKPAKDRSHQRIDGIVAAIMAYGRWLQTGGAKTVDLKEVIRERGGLLTV